MIPVGIDKGRYYKRLVSCNFVQFIYLNVIIGCKTAWNFKIFEHVLSNVSCSRIRPVKLKSQVRMPIRILLRYLQMTKGIWSKCDMRVANGFFPNICTRANSMWRARVNIIMKTNMLSFLEDTFLQQRQNELNILDFRSAAFEKYVRFKF